MRSPASTMHPPSAMEKNRYLRQAAMLVQKWRRRLTYMTEEGMHMYGMEQLQYKEHREEMEYQLQRASNALNKLREADEMQWEDAKFRLEYIFEALEDTWAYWQSVVRKSRQLRHRRTAFQVWRRV